MSNTLNISLGQISTAGIKAENEDHLGAITPDGNLLENKGIAIAIADGMSAAEGGKEASQVSIRMFLDDYFSTPESWSVKKSVTKVMASMNSWLYTQSHQYESSRGMVTTFSAMVIKSHTAHLFHIGDSRIYRFREKRIEQLTHDHRHWVSKDKSYLSRALGIDVNLNIDYRSVAVEVGDVFFLSTDGVHDFLSDDALEKLIQQGLNQAPDINDASLSVLCDDVLQASLEQNSNDNISCQLLRIEQLPTASKNEVYNALSRLPFPPDLSAGQVLDGYHILRELHASSRSQVYLAQDTFLHEDDPASKVVIKTPSVNFEDDPAYIELFLQEEWVGKRLNSPYLLKTCKRNRKRQFLYTVLEYAEGQTLEQWIDDSAEISMEAIRDIITQIAHGLRAMHRMEMLHQDLKPSNILIGNNQSIKIIDFGSTKIAGLAETRSVVEHNHIVGTASYSA
ncbi:MAG: protein kinase, partial [Arenicellales bacterium]